MTSIEVLVGPKKLELGNWIKEIHTYLVLTRDNILRIH